MGMHWPKCMTQHTQKLEVSAFIITSSTIYVMHMKQVSSVFKLHTAFLTCAIVFFSNWSRIFACSAV